MMNDPYNSLQNEITDTYKAFKNSTNKQYKSSAQHATHHLLQESVRTPHSKFKLNGSCRLA
jgi:hypothetical protein